jgi:geranylgeranyl reductase family protein
MKVWDAIVVGAGPAGCACAYDLAASGQTVLLLDKAVFPRMKACAGGLTTKTLRALRYPVEPVVRQTIDRVVLEGRDASRIPVRSRKTICVMTVREELDAYCLTKTIEAGASFQPLAAAFDSIDQGRHEVVVTSQGEVFRGRFLVGADGVNSQVRRMTMSAGWFRKGLALEANLRRDAGRDELVFDFAPVANGYGWIFPKRDHVNVGLYSMSREGALNRERLVDYISQRFGTAASAENYLGQYLGFGAAQHRVEEGRVFLVGDAGGFVDPLTGEGIYGAVVSGQAAAAAINAELQEGKMAWEMFSCLTEGLRQNLSIAERAANSFYAEPARGLGAMKNASVAPGDLEELCGRARPVRAAACRSSHACCAQASRFGNKGLRINKRRWKSTTLAISIALSLMLCTTFVKKSALVRCVQAFLLLP